MASKDKKPKKTTQKPFANKHAKMSLAEVIEKKKAQKNKQPKPKTETAPVARIKKNAGGNLEFLNKFKSEDFIYGTHAVQSALDNPLRQDKILCLTESKYNDYADITHGKSDVKIMVLSNQELQQLLPTGAVHQSVALISRPMTSLTEEDISNLEGLVVILDSITDPHNIGAILRSCAAFDCKALIVQDVHTPTITGVMAKSAAGATDIVPMMRVGNLVRTIEKLKTAGYFVYGADADGDVSLPQAKFPVKTAIIMGAEGDGIRRLVRENCDHILSIPMHAQMESLNVSVATGLILGYYFFNKA